MTVKRFVAPTMRRALDLVRQEMGPDAIILSSQKVKDGIEVITSSEIDVPTRGGAAGKQFSSRFDQELDTPLGSDQAWQTHHGIEQAAKRYSSGVFEASAKLNRSNSERLADEIERARERMIQAKSKSRSEIKAEQPHVPRVKQESQCAAPSSSTSPQNFADPGASNENSSEHLAYLDNLREEDRSSVDKQMAGLQEQMQHMSPQATYSAEGDATHLQSLKNEIADMRMLLEQQMMSQNSRQAANVTPFGSPASEALHGHLTALGLPVSLVNKLTAAVGATKALNVCWRESLAQLSKRIPVMHHDVIAQGGIFALVGATGVGKTTTIAKLAARYVLEHGMGKVALITTDTYRVGAHDQLKALGRILNVPVRVVDQERSLVSVLASLKNFPLVLIDTAGFRQGDPLLSRQESMLSQCPGLKKLLVLACNAQLQTLKASAHAYGGQNLSGCVLTKLDECYSLGELIGVLVEHKIPVMYATDGQSIPDDIDKTNGAKLVAKAVSLMKGQRSAPRSAVGHP